MLSSFRIAYESETFHRRRSSGIFHCESGEQKPQNLPFPLHDVDPHVIQQCLGPPHAPSQTATQTVEAVSHTYAVKSPFVTMARPKFAPKSTPSVDRSPNPNTCLIGGPVRPTMPNGIRIRSAVFFHNALDRPTHRQTDRLCTGKCDDYKPLYASNESDAALKSLKLSLLRRYDFYNLSATSSSD